MCNIAEHSRVIVCGALAARGAHADLGPPAARGARAAHDVCVLLLGPVLLVVSLLLVIPVLLVVPLEFATSAVRNNACRPCCWCTCCS